MKQLQVLFSNEVALEDDRKMRLDYFLTKDYFKSDVEEPYYGIRITKYLDELEESEEVSGISCSKETVLSMIEKFSINVVTPIHLVEIVDDLVTQGSWLHIRFEIY